MVDSGWEGFAKAAKGPIHKPLTFRYLLEGEWLLCLCKEGPAWVQAGAVKIFALCDLFLSYLPHHVKHRCPSKPFLLNKMTARRPPGRHPEPDRTVCELG
jgi:hypothetical protein